MTLAPFGQFAPDIAETNLSVTGNILNVMPISDEVGVAYAPCKSLSSPTGATAIVGTPRGGTSVVDRAGNFFAFVGTSSDIQRFNSAYTWTALGTGYALPSGEVWSALAFGNYALFTNRQDGLQQYDVEAGGAFAAVPNTFAPRFLFTAFDCVFYGDCLDKAGNRDNRLLRNSAFNDHTNLVDGGAGYQIMPDGEELVGGAELSSNFAVVFQKNAIRGLTRTSDGSVYSMYLMAIGVGAVNTQCIASINGVAYFVDTDGFKSVSPSGIRNIGSERVNRTFLGNMGADGLSTIEAAVDPANQRIVWSYQGVSDPSGGPYTAKMAYYYDLDRFAPFDQSTQIILTLATPAYDMDSMSALYPSMDDPTMPDMDSRFWAGGEPRLFGVGATGMGGFFDGPALAARAETATITLNTSRLLNEISLVTDSALATVSIGARDALYASAGYSGQSSVTTTGKYKTRARGRFMSALAEIPAGDDWTFLRGVDDLSFQGSASR